MTTNYPASLDSLTNPTSTDPLSSPSHSAQHANANDAIEAIQQKLGITGTGSPESVVTAPAGSLYSDSSNGFLYYKATGSGDTGWVKIIDADNVPAGYTDEEARDAIGAALTEGTAIDISVSDPGNTITVGVDISGLSGIPVSGISGLGDSATKDVGTGSGDVAAGDHNHSGVYDPAGTAAGLVDDLSGVSNASTARTNLGLGSLATLSTITTSEITDGTITGTDISATAAIALTQLANITTARILGRTTAGAGAIEELSQAGVFGFLGTGTPSSSTFLRGDGTWSVGGAPADDGDAIISNQVFS